MKAIARGYSYWQGIDASIANFVQNCSACIATWNEPADAYSKWIEVIPMKNITASFTIHHLRILFAHYGIPLTLKQSSRLDTESILREFQEGEKVAIRNYSGPNKWKIGTIINRDGTLSYSIQVGNEIWKRHVDQIRKCGKSIELSQAATEIPIDDKELNFPDEPVSDDVAESEPPAAVPEVVPEPKDVPATPSDDIPPKPVPDASGKQKTDVPLRRSTQMRRPPKRLDL
ncbi:unkown protein [Trichonephila clavipes]|nr:unkown protein [Trichonephila clavipes]